MQKSRQLRYGEALREICEEKEKDISRRVRRSTALNFKRSFPIALITQREMPGTGRPGGTARLVLFISLIASFTFFRSPDDL